MREGGVASPLHQEDDVIAAGAEQSQPVVVIVVGEIRKVGLVIYLM